MDLFSLMREFRLCGLQLCLQMEQAQQSLEAADKESQDLSARLVRATVNTLLH